MSLDSSSWGELNCQSASSNDDIPIGSSTEILYDSKASQEEGAEPARRISLNFERLNEQTSHMYASDEDESDEPYIQNVQDNAQVKSLLVGEPKKGSFDSNIETIPITADRKNDDNDIYASDHNEPNNDKSPHKKPQLPGPLSSPFSTTIMDPAHHTCLESSREDDPSDRGQKRPRFPSSSNLSAPTCRSSNTAFVNTKSCQSFRYNSSNADTQPHWARAPGASIPFFSGNNNNRPISIMNEDIPMPGKTYNSNKNSENIFICLSADAYNRKMEAEDEARKLRRRQQQQPVLDVPQPLLAPDAFSVKNHNANVTNSSTSDGCFHGISTSQFDNNDPSFAPQNKPDCHDRETQTSPQLLRNIADHHDIKGKQREGSATSVIPSTLLDTFKFKNHIDQYQAGLSIRDHLRKLKPFDQWNGIRVLDLRRQNLVTIYQLDRIVPCLENLDVDQLESFDVSYNRVQQVDSIKILKGLKFFNLDHNDLRWIRLEEPAEKLKVLRLSYNHLREFDAAFFPDLRTLYLDDNRIVRIVGLSCLARLESFSLRDQGGQKVDINLSYLRSCRKIYISGNPLKHLSNVLDFFTLQYLEICSLQLEELPHGFARQVPNLAVLYLSHNFLKNIRPLRKLRQLQKLVVIDNRIGSLGHVAETIRPMTKLRYLDLRQNPITLKLYPQLSTHATQPHEKISHYLAHEYDHQWSTRDAEFCQKDLPPHWAKRRSLYRAFLLNHSPELTMLDNIVIDDQDRIDCEKVLESFLSEHQDYSSL
ncbi:hypothetical protein EC973_005325 [Apophysomyces ossiformis]|uniref:L domain-like protein n=1 Tax=Apophysomyces ossiformis TaxID=679940 RepID=A0A8H7ESX4_9FUNG|nr:hypothetical protein EC973_005325 [Apophysomyces ossiformis]